jgi:hypothetical protein
MPEDEEYFYVRHLRCVNHKLTASVKTVTNITQTQQAPSLLQQPVRLTTVSYILF